jgi:carbon monoxide dehydrogenase subunit G
VNLSGTVTLPADPQQVWSLLTDPQRLARLLPGCERLDPDGPHRFRAAVKFGVAAISGKYAGTLELSQLKPPHSLAIGFDGRGLPGFVKGRARIELLRKGPATELHYSGEAQVGGMMATVGQRLLEAAARKIVQQFFDAAASELESTASDLPTTSSRTAVARPGKKR